MNVLAFSLPLFSPHSRQERRNEYSLPSHSTSLFSFSSFFSSTQRSAHIASDFTRFKNHLLLFFSRVTSLPNLFSPSLLLKMILYVFLELIIVSYPHNFQRFYEHGGEMQVAQDAPLRPSMDIFAVG